MENLWSTFKHHTSETRSPPVNMSPTCQQHRLRFQGSRLLQDSHLAVVYEDCFGMSFSGTCVSIRASLPLGVLGDQPALPK